MKKTITQIFFVLIALTSINTNAQDFSKQIENYFTKNSKKFNINENDISNYIITDQYQTKKGNLSHVYINQTVNGVMVYNAMANFTFKDGVLTYVSNSLEGNLQSRLNSTSPTITAQEAILKAASNLNLKTQELPRIKEEKANNTFIFSDAGISENNIPVRLYLKPQEDNSIKLIWEVNINNFKTGKWWNIDIDASNGAVLQKKNTVLSCFSENEFKRELKHEHNSVNNEFSLLRNNTSMLSGSGSYNVYAIPLKHPLDGSRSIVNNPADATASPYGWHDTNGMVGAELTITQGNNVLAHADIAGDNSIGFQPDGTATLDFNFPLDLTNEPTGYRNASVTNLFYINNIMHDVWYHYGFDEAAGNFQQNNYGNGGTGGDYVIADGQDGSGNDNANFSTPADGSNPRMQMYLWDYPYILKRLKINNPTAIAGDYTAVKPGSSSDTNTNPLYYNISGYTFTWKTGDIILADDGATGPAQDGVGLANVEGCGDYVNPANYSGKIVLIKRGNCTFAEKLRKAKNANAAGALIYQRASLATETPGTDYFNYVNMSGDANPAPSINSQFIGKDDAATIIAEINGGTAVNVTMTEPAAIPKRDGSLETNIVSHEYAHGISTRLTGGASNSGCLTSFEQMGEGWSDWAAFMMTLSASSTATEELNMGDYVLWGRQLREAPYTTDMSVNGYTYIYTTQVDGEVHSIGFVWASILWDLTWAYIDQYGYDADLYNGTGGNNKIMEAVMLAMKMQPCNPDFISGRDAILAADDQLTGDGSAGSGQNQGLIWNAFATRGVGLNATAGGNEDYTIPAALVVSETELDNDFVKIYPNPSNGVFNITSLRNIENASIAIVDVNGRIVYKEVKTIQGTSSIDLSNLNTGIYIMKIKGDNFNKTEKIIIK
jgi:hypothetical protein